jgi:hypothetical protein
VALSLETLHQPLSDFFVAKLGAPAGASVQFRFDKLGSVLSDADFIDEAHPDLGFLPGLAIEKFSDLVNRVPVDAGDGTSVVLSQDSIDDIYNYRLLGPSVPWLPAGVDDVARESLTQTFMNVKAKGNELWAKLSMASLTGLMLQYKPSLATPESWYDSAAKDVWTSQRFEIEQPAAAPAPPENARLWKLAVSPEVLGQVIDAVPPAPEVVPETPVAVPVEPQPFPDRSDRVLVRSHLSRRLESVLADRVVATPEIPRMRMASRLGPMRVRGLAGGLGGPLAGAVRLRAVDLATEVASAEPIAPITPEPVVADPGPVAVLQPMLLEKRLARFDIRDRLLVKDVVADATPTAPATTNKVVVTFDYCIVRVRRPWMLDVFLDSDGWAIPGVERGALSKPGAAGGITQLPIAMVVVRNLVITANWSADDIATSDSATAFGPFKIDGGVVDGSLTHPSVQTIGWLLDQLPPLPPQNYAPAQPGATPATPAPPEGDPQ